MKNKDEFLSAAQELICDIRECEEEYSASLGGKRKFIIKIGKL